MELPQSPSFGAEGRKPTHDFLSRYSHSSVQQDPTPPSQGGHLKTHDFLQLERPGKTSAKEETPVTVATAAKLPPPPPSVEHVLPGGIGTYSISHISYYKNPRVPKPEGAVITVAQGSSCERNDENSNCSSYSSASGFTLWEESAEKKGKTRKENAGETAVVRELAGQVGQSTLEKASHSSTNNRCNSFSSLSCSQPPSKQKSLSFMEMIQSAKGSALDDDFEEDEDFILKKESSPSTHNGGELRVKVDGKCAPDQKANTPRSKHSATEQRRRSKINDRFQMLRGLIPRSDQKRDKASFLLEVIEYIQFLQEKVHKCEGTYQGWSHQPSKSMPWRNNQRLTEYYADQSRAMVFSANLDEKNIAVAPPAIFGTEPNAIESDMSKATIFRAVGLGPGMMNKTIPFPVSQQPNVFTSAPKSTSLATQLAPRLQSDPENNASQPQSVLCHTGSCTIHGNVPIPGEKLKEQETTFEGGTISISSVYSQGLLKTLTQALQTSGVDLSHASISVQIEVGKRSGCSPTAPTSTLKDTEGPSRNQTTMARSRVGCGEDSDQQQQQPLKKLKT